MQLSINLVDAEYAALAKLSQEELRTPEDQAHYILRTTLYELGLLQPSVVVVPKQRRPPAQRSTTLEETKER